MLFRQLKFRNVKISGGMVLVFKNFQKGKFGALIIISILSVIFVLSGCGTSNDSSTASNTNNKNSDSDELDSSVTLRILDAGGESSESVEVAYIKPFTEKTGIKVIRENPTELGKLQAMVEAGQDTYDLVELGSNNAYQAMAQGLLQEIDWDLVNPDPINEEAKTPYMLGYQYYSTVMIWDADKGKELNSWADFWDVEKYPGKRALPDFPTYALPIALLADGVPIDEIYPIDIDRAFKSLEKIKDHVSVWWTSGAQPTQLVKDGEVDYAAAWSGRVVGNTDNIAYTYNQGLLDMSGFVIPKTTKNVKEVSALLHEMTIAENQAKAAEIIPYTGPAKNISEFLPQDRLHEFPTSEENYAKQVLPNPEWWYENAKEVEERWQLFKMSR